MHFSSKRNYWLLAMENELMKDCEIRNFKAGGPGGQRQNKVATAVRLVHKPTGIAVTASESRNQQENRLKAVKKLRKKIALKIRSEEIPEIKDFGINQKNQNYPLLVARLLDDLYLCEFRLRDTAENLGLSTAKMIKILSKDHELWQEINIIRERLGLKKLEH